MEAFRLAVAQGADAIELDVRSSADGHLVVHHDARLPDGRTIAALTRAELPASVPDLGDALDACRGAWVNLEIKNASEDPDFDHDRRLARAVVELLAGRDEPSTQWLISSFDLATVDAVRAARPTLSTAFLVYEIDDAAVAAAVTGGHHALHPWEVTVDAAAIERAAASGLRVNVWTCNDAERMRELIGWGVDGICTDVPDVARGVVDERRAALD